MTDPRPIIGIRFRTPVNLPNETTEWFATSPPRGVPLHALTVRTGDPDRGEQRTSVVFELRLGGANGDIDIEVPAANIAMIQRKPVEQAKAVKK